MIGFQRNKNGLRPSADPEFDGGYGTDLPILDDDDGSFPEGEGEPEGEYY